MKSIARFATLLTVFAIPSVSFAAFSVYSNSNGQFSFAFGSGNSLVCGANNICQVASTLLYLINYVAVPLLFAIAFIVFLWGVFKSYIYSHGDANAVSEGHRLILWGIIGFVVMISLWGLVNVVANTFGLQGYSAPPTPTSYGPYAM